MAKAILSGTTIVRDPETLSHVVLHAGDELPEWATDMVGEHLLGGTPVAAQEEAPAPVVQKEETPISPYKDMKNADLEDMIEARNEGRDEKNLIKPASTKKDDLIAALVADDQKA